MGACFISTTLDGKMTKAQVLSQFQEMSNQAAYDHGHSYSGSWNMLAGLEFPNTEIFKSRNEASYYISEHAQKWEAGLCVRFRDVKAEFISPPTFGGKKIGNVGCQIVHVEIDWKTQTGYRQLQLAKVTPADQLTDDEKKKAVQLYTDNREKEHRSRAAMSKWPECGFYNASGETVLAAIKEAGAARTALREFEQPLINRLWAVKNVPYEGWLLGGWASE